MKNNMYKAFAGLLAMIAAMCTVVISCGTEQTISPDPNPLVINTVEDGDDMLLTVIRENGETVFQYEGDIEMWKGADGKAYGIIDLDEEVSK